MIRYCLVGIAVLAFGVLYWALWRIVPRWFGYDFVPRKEKLSDGTVVTVVRLVRPRVGLDIRLMFGYFRSSRPKSLTRWRLWRLGHRPSSSIHPCAS